MEIMPVHKRADVNINTQNFKGNLNNSIVKTAIEGNKQYISLAGATSIAAITIALNNIREKNNVNIEKYINPANKELAEYLMNIEGLDKSKIPSIMSGTILRHPDYHFTYSDADRIYKYLEVLKNSKTSKYMIDKLNNGESLHKALFDLELANNSSDYYFL